MELGERPQFIDYKEEEIKQSVNLIESETN